MAYIERNKYFVTHVFLYSHNILANNLKMQNYNLDVSQYGCKKAPEGNCIAGIGKNWYSEYTSCNNSCHMQKKINKYETAKRTIHNLKLQKLQLSHITLMNNTKNVQQNDKYWLIQNTILL